VDERKRSIRHDGDELLRLVPATEVAALAIGARLATLDIPAEDHLVDEVARYPELAAANLVEVGATIGPWGLCIRHLLTVHTHLSRGVEPHDTIARKVGAGIYLYGL
jgi:hypothetical protein